MMEFSENSNRAISMEEKIMPHLAVLPPQHQRYLTASRQFLPPAPALSHATTTGINRPRSSQQSFLAKSANDAISLNAPALLSLSTRSSPATSTNKQIYMLRPQKRKESAVIPTPKRGRGMAKDKQEKLQLMEAGKLSLGEAVPGKDRAAQNKKAEYRKMLKPDMTHKVQYLPNCRYELFDLMDHCMQKLAGLIGSLLAGALINQEYDATLDSRLKRCEQARKTLHLMAADRDGFGWLLKGVEQHVIKVQHPLENAMVNQALAYTRPSTQPIQCAPTSFDMLRSDLKHSVVEAKPTVEAHLPRNDVQAPVHAICKRRKQIHCTSPYRSVDVKSCQRFGATDEAAALLLSVAKTVVHGSEREDEHDEILAKKENTEMKVSEEDTVLRMRQDTLNAPLPLSMDAYDSGSCKRQTLRWHCAGTLRTYVNHKRVDGDWTQCPNIGCRNFAKWDSENNLRCKVCQIKNRQRRKDDKPALHWRWVRCAAENCKAMYVFNRGSRLKRSADRCGLLKRGSKNLTC